MPKVLIVVEASAKEVAEASTARMVSALRQAITTCASPPVTIQVVTSNSLELTASFDLDSELSKSIMCPLTLNLPERLVFPAKVVYQACRDITGLRLRLAQQLKLASTSSTRDLPISDEHFWLPIVLTAKGPLYGEVIGIAGKATGAKKQDDLSVCDLSYYQPFHLSDSRKQELYQIGHCLMQLLSAPPATYLVEFAFQDSDIYFDRLWPFPAAPAMASLGVQAPDLFFSHWCCLTDRPVIDLVIPPIAD